MVVSVIVYHCLENHLCVDIPLHFSGLCSQDFFEDHDETRFLEHQIEILISEHEAQEDISDLDSRLFPEVFTKSLPVYLPPELIESGVQVLSVDKRIVLLHTLDS